MKLSTTLHRTGIITEHVAIASQSSASHAAISHGAQAAAADHVAIDASASAG